MAGRRYKKLIIEYLCLTNDHRYAFVVNTSRSFPHSRLITGFVTRLTRRVSLVEQELLTLPVHLRSPPDCSGVRATRSLSLCFVDRCLSFCPFFFWPLCCLSFLDLQILITSLWYLQTLPIAWPSSYYSWITLFIDIKTL